MIKPIEDKVVIKPIVKEEEVTASGIVIAGAAKPKPSEAEVIAVGPGMIFPNGEKMIIDLKPGDKVYFAQYGGQEITHNGVDYLVLPYRDIYAVIVDDEA